VCNNEPDSSRFPGSPSMISTVGRFE
jgi:hypothetical protein